MQAVQTLCYIPTFGGGFGMSRAEALAMPLDEVQSWLDFMEDAHNREDK